MADSSHPKRGSGCVGLPNEELQQARSAFTTTAAALVTRSSSDWVQGRDGKWVRGQFYQTRGLTRQRHPVLKAIFKGAATSVIQQLPEDRPHEHYERMLACGIKPNLAKLTVARRVAAIVLAMWKHQEVYDPRKHVVVTDKA